MHKVHDVTCSIDSSDSCWTMSHAIDEVTLLDGTTSKGYLAYTMRLAIEKEPFVDDPCRKGEFTKAFKCRSDRIKLAYIRTTTGERNVDILNSLCTADWSWCCVAHLFFFVSLIL